MSKITNSSKQKQTNGLHDQYQEHSFYKEIGFKGMRR